MDYEEKVFQIIIIIIIKTIQIKIIIITIVKIKLHSVASQNKRGTAPKSTVWVPVIFSCELSLTQTLLLKSNKIKTLKLSFPNRNYTHV